MASSQRSSRRSSMPASSSLPPASSSSSRSRATSLGRSNAPLRRSHQAAKSPSEKQTQDAAESHISELPADLLCKCFAKLECVYHIVACASVSRAWRSALETDMFWRDYYWKWHGPNQELPPGSATWRQAFVKDLEQGRERLLRKAFGWAAEVGLIEYPESPITDSKLAAGVHFHILAEYLSLTFFVRINGGAQCRISTKGTSFFPASVLLHYPFKSVKRNTKLVSLGSIEVVVLSDRLSQRRTVVYSSSSQGFDPWDAVTSSSPLRLLQHNVSPGVNLIVGTLSDCPEVGNRMAVGQEEVLFIKVGLHLYLVLTEMMKLKQPRMRTHGLSASHINVQLHTFQKLLWTFSDVIVSSENTLLQSSQLVFGKPSLPWRSEAFSGELEHTLVATFTLWDPRAEVVWSYVKIFQLIPVSVPSLEYSLSMSEGARFDGVIHDRERGISARLAYWLPFEEELQNAFVLTDFRMFIDRIAM